MKIRRITYPATICVLAWLRKHNLWNSKFSTSTYVAYRHFGESYRKLYRVMQSLFDQYIVLSKSL